MFKDIRSLVKYSSLILESMEDERNFPQRGLKKRRYQETRDRERAAFKNGFSYEDGELRKGDTIYDPETDTYTKDVKRPTRTSGEERPVRNRTEPIRNTDNGTKNNGRREDELNQKTAEKQNDHFDHDIEAVKDTYAFLRYYYGDNTDSVILDVARARGCDVSSGKRGDDAVFSSNVRWHGNRVNSEKSDSVKQDDRPWVTNPVLNCLNEVLRTCFFMSSSSDKAISYSKKSSEENTGSYIKKDDPFLNINTDKSKCVSTSSSTGRSHAHLGDSRNQICIFNNEQWVKNHELSHIYNSPSFSGDNSFFKRSNPDILPQGLEYCVANPYEFCGALGTLRRELYRKTRGAVDVSNVSTMKSVITDGKGYNWLPCDVQNLLVGIRFLYNYSGTDGEILDTKREIMDRINDQSFLSQII